MDGWIDRQIGRQINRQIDKKIDRQIYGQMDVQINQKMKKWIDMDELQDGQMDFKIDQTGSFQFININRRICMFVFWASINIFVLLYL